MPEPTPHVPTPQEVAAAAVEEVTKNGGKEAFGGRNFLPFILMFLLGGGSGNIIGQITGTTEIKSWMVRTDATLAAMALDIKALKDAEAKRSMEEAWERRHSTAATRDWDGDTTGEAFSAKRGEGGQATPR